MPGAKQVGLQGWTEFNLKTVSEEIMLDVLDVAYMDFFKRDRKTKN